MNKRKLLALLLALMMVLSFAACGTQAAESAPVETPVETSVVEDAAMSYFANFPEDRHVISPADLFAKIDAGEDMFIIDIRTPEDYAKGHVAGAVNLPFGNGAIAANLEAIPDNVPVYVYCYTGQTASQTIALLNVAGKPAYNVQSGFVRGISVEPGYEAYLSTEEVAIPTDTYAVDPEIKAAIEEYYATVSSYAGTTTEAQNIKVDTVKEIIDSGSDEYLILSVRKAEDYAKGHVPTAINIPFGAGMETALSELPTDKKIIVYCYTGQTASQTVAILRLMGFEAYNMQFGMGSVETESGWLGAGYETVTE